MQCVKFPFTYPFQIATSQGLMTLSSTTTSSIKNELLARRDTLARDLALATAEMLDEELNFTDSVDQAAQDTDRGLIVQMKNRDRGLLVQIDEALRRMDSGIFGECDSCGESITEARLRVAPATTLCIDCKAELESRQAKYPGRA